MHERLKIALRIGTAASAIFLAREQGVLPPNLAALNQFTSPRGAIAAEAESPEFQDITTTAIKKLLEMFQNRDLAAIRDSLHPTSDLYWDVFGVNTARSPKTPDVMIQYFRTSFEGRGVPVCLGYEWDGPSLIVLFDKLSNPNISAKSQATGKSFVFLVFDRTVTMRIVMVQEAIPIPSTATQANNMNLLPCPKIEAVVPPTPRPVLLPTPVPVGTPEKQETLQSIYKGKVVFTSIDGNNEQIFIANIDGSQKQQLTKGEGLKRESHWLDSQTIVYSVREANGGLFVVNLASGKQTQLTQNSGWSDIEPVRAGAGIVFSRRKGYAQVDLYYIERDGTGLRQLTHDATYNVEEHAAVSPDGKLIAYSSHAPGQHGRPVGMVIESFLEIEKNFDRDRRPVFVTGAVPLGWSPDGQKILYFHEGTPRILFTADKEGKNINRIADNIFGASFSGDGKYIIVAGRDSTFVIPATGGKPLPLSLEKTFEIDWQPLETAIVSTPLPKPAPAPNAKPEIINTVTKRRISEVPGLFTEVKNGHVVSGTFDALNQDLQLKGYSPADIILNSLGGMFLRSDGRYDISDQSCDDTLYSLKRTGSAYAEFFLSDYDAHPGEPFTGIAHSNGGNIMLGGMEKVRKIRPDINLHGYKFLLVHSPVHGIDKPLLSNLGTLFSPEFGANCKLGDIPNLGTLNYPVLVELRDFWRDYDERDADLEDTVGWMKKQGAEVVSLYSLNDCLISFRYCRLDDWSLAILLFKILRLPIQSPYLPGAINIEQFLGWAVNDPLGHGGFLRDSGLKILESFIDRQVTGFDREGLQISGIFR